MLTEQAQDTVRLIQAEITATEAAIALHRAKRIFVPPKKESNRLSRLEAINQAAAADAPAEPDVYL
jgi:hypothetical protein